MTQPPLSIESLPRALEAVRRRYSLPLGRRAADALAALSAPLQRRLAPARRTLAEAAAKIQASRLGRMVVAAGSALAQTRAAAIERGDAFAAQSRSLCRELAEPFTSPQAAALAVRRAPRHLEAAGRAAYARLRQARPTDALIALLAIGALAAPIASPRLSDDATIALTRHNPFAFRTGVLAEWELSLLPKATPTLWTGVEAARAERAVAPEWVLRAGEDSAPLPLELALTAPHRTIDVGPAPLWSPTLAAEQALMDPEEYASLATASIPDAPGPRQIPLGPLDADALMALELGAIDTGPTLTRLPLAAAAAPSPQALLDGDYETASIRDAFEEPAWPASPEEAISPTLDEVLSAEEGLLPLPLKIAPIPSIRPVRSGPGRTARVTVVLTAIGLNETASRRALESLPSAVAFAVAPVGAAPEKWVGAAQSRGRVALLEIPMEPQSYPRINPGPLTLLSEAAASENAERLAAALAKAPGADGVATYLGGRFAARPDAAKPVLSALKEQGLFMLETNPGPLSQLRRVAAEVGLPAASSVVSLDKAGRAADLSEGFARLEEAAKQRGHAIGVAVAVPETVAALSEWLETLPRRGFRLTALAL